MAERSGGRDAYSASCHPVAWQAKRRCMRLTETGLVPAKDPTVYGVPASSGWRRLADFLLAAGKPGDTA